MVKYFAAAFIAASSIMALGSSNAFAKGATHISSGSRPAFNATWTGEAGTASYYGPGFHGHRAADGSRFDQTRLTAAHPWLPFGSKVKVTSADTGRTVVVIITDRLPATGRIVDLSIAAARRLGMIQRGLAPVLLDPV